MNIDAIRKHARECVEPETCPFRHFAVGELLTYTETLKATLGEAHDCILTGHKRADLVERIDSLLSEGGA